MTSRAREVSPPDEQVEAAPAPRQALPPQSQVALVLALQRSAGNASVSRRLARFQHASAAPTFAGSKSRPMLRANQTDPAVNELQHMLNKAGAVPPLAATGTMDGPTRQAVVKFQGECGLQRDCIVGPLTWGALDRVTGTPSGTVGPDQHDGVHDPTADEQSKIHGLLFPARGKDDTKWDGTGRSPQALANRTALKAAMTQAIRAALDKVTPDVEKWAAADRMPIAKLEPAGKEGKRLADEQFQPLVAAAARTQSQEAGLAAFDYTAGVNLFDAADTTARPPSAFQASAFLALSDTKSKSEMAAHHLDKDRTQEESDFFFDEVVTPFADAHKAPLEKYHRFGFSNAGNGKVSAQTTLDDPAFPNTPADPNEPTPAERHLMWKMLHTLVHEYIHLLEHPACVHARGNNDVIREGFCEMFTKDVMVPVTARAKAGDPALRTAVEGGDFPKGFKPELVPDYAPADQYSGFLAAAEGVRATAGAAAVKAAFFQGHVELLGLTPEGRKATPAAPGTTDLVKVPSVVQTPFALGVMTGSSEAAIMTANPGLKASGPLPPKVHVPGCRYHRVVEAVETAPGGGAPTDRQAESAEQIATQNGITVADLERANPGLNRRVPKAGEELLIPLRA